MARKIEVQILGDSSGLSRAFNDAAGSTNKFGSALGKTAKYAALAIGAAGIGGIAVTLRAGIKEFSEAAKVGAQTNAVLKSTGGIANVTSGQVSKLAESLMRKSGVDDEAIQSGENMLLTFTRVRNEAGKGNDVFNQATKATLDLSVAMGKDMTSSAMLVGKALNDPIKGMAALSRAGIQFTDAQKKAITAMVESGNVMGAQKIILGELTTQFGGSAEAIGKTLPGQLNILKESFSNMAGEIVNSAVPAFTAVMNSVSDFVSRLGEAEGARAKLDVVFGAIKTGVTTLADGIRSAFNAIDWNAVGQTLLTGLTRAVTFLASIDWTGHLRAVGTRVFNALRSAFNAIDWNKLGRDAGDFLIKSLNRLSEFMGQVDWNRVGAALVTGMGKVIQALATFLAGVDWPKVLAAIGKGIIAVLAALGGIVVGAATVLGGKIIEGIRAGLASLIVRVAEKMSEFWAWLKTLPGQALTLALEIGKALVTGIISGIGDLAGRVAGAVEGGIRDGISKAGSILSGSGPYQFTIHRVGKPLAAGVIEGFLLGITALPTAVEGKLRESLDRAKATVDRYRAVLGDAFGNLGDFVKRAFDAKTQNLLDNVTKRFDAQIAKWQKYADALTPAEKALAALDEAEQKRARDAAVASANEQMLKAQAMAEGAERDAAILAAAEAQRIAQLAITRAGLEAQAEVERAAREKEAAEHIAKLEATKARELQNLEERRRQTGEKLSEQLADLSTWLSKHPGEYDKVNAKVLALMKKFGIPMKEAGKNLGTAFAKGLRESAKDVESAAAMLAKIVRDFFPHSPAKRGPLRDPIKWNEYLASGLRASGAAMAQAAGGAAGFAGAAVAGPAFAGAGVGTVIGRPLVVQFQLDSRTIAEATYPDILVVDKRHGGRILNHGASVLT